MYILGFNCYAHDSAAAIIRDGELIGSVEEERFVRKKHVGSFPHHAIAWCCEEAGIAPHELDHIVYYWNPYAALGPRALHMLRYFPRSVALALRRRDSEMPMYLLPHTVRKELTLTHKTKFHYAPHHVCHAASSFFLSPFETAAILTMDSIGEWESTWFGRGTGNQLEHIQSVTFPHSVGLVYSAVTDFLGFRSNTGEGKVMGLAPYGDPDRYYPYFADILQDAGNGTFTVNLDYFTYHYKGKPHWYSKKFFSVFGKPRPVGDEIKERHKDIAAALQKRIEEVGVAAAQWLHKKTKSDNLCLSGGVCLNSVMNGKILEESGFKHLYIKPAAHDSGTSIGACYWLWNQVMKQRRPKPLTTAYLGPSYSDDAYQSAVARADSPDISIQYVHDAPQAAAEALAQGKIIGWFQDRMEIGPRALGNRSILADPRHEEMKDTLNSRVKFREGFRPFAPSVRVEKLGEWFTHTHPSPFMLLVYDVLPEKRDQVAAITHVDGTGRVQSVAREENEKYYDLIAAFEKKTGVPIVLNTSFNIRGEPIVNTPDEAIACFMKTGMDMLFLGNYCLAKNVESSARALSEEEIKHAHEESERMDHHG